MASNEKKSQFSGSPQHPHDPSGDGAGSEDDFFDNPEDLIAAEEAALEAEEMEERESLPKTDPASLKAQIAELTDRLLRAHADMDNQRKMAEREREDLAKYAISKFAKDIVQVGDNFQRAISAVPGDAVDKDPALKSFLDGVSMLDREFHNILERHGIVRLEPTGEAFNPHLHQAMMEQEDTSVPQGTVVQVIQSGYQIADRVLRPAMVVVSKGGAKQKPAGSDNEPNHADNENNQVGASPDHPPDASGEARAPDPGDTNTS